MPTRIPAGSQVRQASSSYTLLRSYVTLQFQIPQTEKIGKLPPLEQLDDDMQASAPGLKTPGMRGRVQSPAIITSHVRKNLAAGKAKSCSNGNRYPSESQVRMEFARSTKNLFSVNCAVPESSAVPSVVVRLDGTGGSTSKSGLQARMFDCSSRTGRAFKVQPSTPLRMHAF
ncbi:hypothetical protein CC1G_15796 [Coprinopsis cinerea okayama7|uniref:Uncharacterized protein n=1 Tax=Coprinopsis cinerea (strain Okayama-7 / 130 / ATCC MYA-4618 / FGSC 9003) TaxID=240176 RepID=D6RQZ9_COPC7|nr:hypothetical protein CC1G_15796 [Coprinopsis cinerea okayama7\|eukprot:XP_002910076.1 hypothetical protein CC1G_15796 [Coprinopsis cinerea okayama7\